MAMLKSKVGMPAPRFGGAVIHLAAEARKARRRLYPVTVLYSTYSLAVLGLALRSGRGPHVALGFYGGGWMAWTLVEYVAHRWVLHFRFPDGPGPVQHWLHRTFDSLHSEHHERPWDGDHINGTIKDTLLYVSLIAALSFLAPLPTAPVLWAGVMQAYVVEEWVHQSVHYLYLYRLKGRYWRYIGRHHCYHHSRRGSEVAFGLTNGFWDIVFDTRIPAADRRRLHRRPPAPAPAR
jgi:4-hydroxysphinganine ceramide fatty acyl 2-hydroxylase